MSAIGDSTRGFERLDPRWHSQLDCVQTVEEVVGLARDFLATLTPAQLLQLPERCRPIRVKAEDDIEYWTFKLSTLAPGEAEDAQLAQDVFMHFLHASLRLAHIHRERARQAIQSGG